MGGYITEEEAENNWQLETLYNDIMNEQKSNMMDDKIFANVRMLVALAEESKDIFIKGKLSNLGKALDSGWNLKKSFANSIANKKINRLYKIFIERGAIGGKLLGAGNEGFLLIYADDHDKFCGISEFSSIPLNIDNQGTKVIFSE